MPVASRAVSRRALVLLASTMAVLGAVGTALPASATVLPRTAARRAVERSVHDAYPDLAFGNVACPARIERSRGVTFTCTVQLPGTFLVVDAKQTDGKGTIDLTTQQAVIPTQGLRDLVAQNASIPATVHCGVQPYRVARAGQVITCAAALADGTNREVDLMVEDTAGNVTVTAVR